MANQQDCDDDMTSLVAYQIRKEFLLRRRLYLSVCYGVDVTAVPAAWDGGFDRRGCLHKPVWRRLAETAIARSLDPRYWVDVLYDNMHVIGRDPVPNDLLNKQILERAAARDENLRVDLGQIVSTGRNELYKRAFIYRKARGARPADAMRLALHEVDGVQANAITRVIVAIESNMPDEANPFLAEARAQFLVAQESYRAVLNENPRRDEIFRRLSGSKEVVS